jgi:Zn-dependent peptidase ImmA (M78 family)
VPDFGSPFEIFCDTWVRDGDESRIAFRIAHELGHTLFYDWGQSPPKQLIPTSSAEEQFCDQFAESFLALLSEKSHTSQTDGH